MKKNLFPVTDGKTKRYVPVEHIKYVHAKGAYSMLFMLDGRQYCVSRYLGKVETQLKTSKLFFRSHESVLLNVLCMNWEHSPGPLTLPMIDGTQQLFARRKKKSYKDLRRKMTAGK